MWLESIEIFNYQGFSDSGLIRLDRGFNLIVGRNNTGKSALLRALSLRITGSPHRSLVSAPQRNSVVSPISTIRVIFNASAADVRAAVFSRQTNWNIPVPSNAPGEVALAEDVWRRLMTAESIPFQCSIRASINAGPGWTATGFPAMRAYETAPNQYQIFQAAPNFDTETLQVVSGPNQVSADSDSGVSIAQHVASTGIYQFTAERLHLARHAFGFSDVLAPNAANLPEVLSTLRRNPPRFEAYARLVREVFPSITTVTIQPQQANQVEIMIWQTPPELERDDLAISLESCGTGVGQVLAILYVVKTSDSPRTILIDEPNSFLHPGAARALIRILKRFNQHQYVIATHSPEVISEIGPARVINLQFKDGRSIVEQFDRLSVDIAAGILGDLGARLSDVLGYERVVWVEGSSDADVFALIARGYPRESLTTAFLPVRSTASFDGKKLREVLHLHRELSKQGAPVPPVVLFVFDREGKSETEIMDLKRESNNAMHFLNWRMLENYLLNAGALSSLIDHLDHDRPDPISEEVVTAWLGDHGREREYLASEFDVGSTDWLRTVHAGKLLSTLISDLTEARLEYRKTRDAPWLVEWLLKDRPQELTELEEIVRDVLDADAQN